MVNIGKILSRSNIGVNKAKALIILFAVICITVGVSGAIAGTWYVFKIAYFILCLTIGVFFYCFNQQWYIGFSLWLWFLNPLIRRLIDYRAGLDPVNPVILAPYAVTLITIYTFLKKAVFLDKKYLNAFTFLFIGLWYGYVVGVVKNGLASSSYDLLTWVVPVFFGIHLFLNYKQYPLISKTISLVFMWGVFIMGVYGFIQFIHLFDWDRNWMILSNSFNLGSADEFNFRVFSTLNAPAYYVVVVLAGLFLLFNCRGFLVPLAAVFGYGTLFLTQIRRGWAMAFLGTLVIFITADWKLRLKIIKVLLIAALAISSFLAFNVNIDLTRVEKRFDSFHNITEDKSINTRILFLCELSWRFLTHPVGEGLGSVGQPTRLANVNREKAGWRAKSTKAFDSSAMHILFALGWPGALLYLLGFAFLVAEALKRKWGRGNYFEIITKTIIFIIAIDIFFCRALLGVAGVVFWSFLCLSLAAEKYYRYKDAA